MNKEIKIGGFKVKVIVASKLITERNKCGEYSPANSEIRIDDTLDEQQRNETFIHELLEAIKSIYSIDLKHDQLALLATVLHQVSVDNPNVFDFKEGEK